MFLKIGELAKQTGITIRTLRHYDSIGLLRPSVRSDAAYRLYGPDDIARLHRIQALKQLGMALADIGLALDDEHVSVSDLIARQLNAVTEQLEEAKALQRQLRRLQSKLGQGALPSTSDWLITLERMAMYDKYFTQAEQETLERLGTPESEARWYVLINKVRAMMTQGVAPGTEAARACASQWLDMLEERVGSDPTLMLKLHSMATNEASEQERSGITPDMMAYVTAAISATRRPLYARYLTEAELQAMDARRIQHAAEWPPLIMELRALMNSGADATDPEVRAAVRRWQALFDATMSGGDPAIREKLRLAFSQEPELLRGSGIDPALIAYIRHVAVAIS